MPKVSRGGKRTIQEKKYALYDERYNKINAIKEQEKQNMIKLMRQGVVIPEARKMAREEAEAQIERINSEYDEKIFKLNESARGMKKTSNNLIPKGMSKAVYEEYVSQGFSNSEIQKIWEDTKTTRRLNQKRRSRSEQEVTSSTYERSRRRSRNNVNNFIGRGLT